MRGSVDVEQPWQQQQQQQPHAGNPPTHVQTTPVYVVAGVIPAQEPLPCFGLGLGWTLFILGLIFGTVPWYVGAILLCCAIHKKDPREKAGCIACLTAAIIVTILIIVWIIAAVVLTSRKTSS